jgi:O-antigen ligase/polysaccharide polymerase Wzy-like membrane protein/tetratricopeptide repeat protein
VSARAEPTERGGLPAPSPRGLRWQRRPGPARGTRGVALPRVPAAAVATFAVAAALSLITFVAGGGLSLGPATTVEVTLTLAGGVAVAATVATMPMAGRIDGIWPASLLLALATLTALSVVWSVQPDDSWQEASRTLAYAATFALAVALVRVAPRRWGSMLGGVALAGVVVAGYALLTKVVPDKLNPDEIYARLEAPYGYWNAIGLTAALAVPPCLWLGARRTGHAALRALAYPALGLLLVTLMLAYSRGALLALALGLAFWFGAVPLRLRGATVLLASAAGAAIVVVWTFSKQALTKDRVPMPDRVAAGHQLGVLLAAMLISLLIAGLAIGFLTAKFPPSRGRRRRAGTTLLVGLALVPLLLVAALLVSHRGLVGSISHDVSALTDPHARVPPNDPSRLTAIGSVRARYWDEALQTWKNHPLVGVGAGGYDTARLRYRTDTLNVRHAHGYVVQTLADLGLVGLALNLALLAVWLAAAARSTRPFDLIWRRAGPGPRGWLRGRLRRAPGPFSPERVGLLTLLTTVIVFGVHSFVDWTWFVPGNACVALLCAGWLAGRGPGGASGPDVAPPAQSAIPATADAPPVPFSPPPPTATSRRRIGLPNPRRIPPVAPGRAAAAAAVLVVALLAAWAELQPERSVNAATSALVALDQHNLTAARAAAEAAVSRDPLSVDARFDLAVIQSDSGRLDEARATLERAVRLQPSNPETWLQLAIFELNTTNDARTAIIDLRPALYLDPQSSAAQAYFVQATRELGPASAASATLPAPASPGARAPG